MLIGITESHIVNVCHLTMLSDGGLQRLHLANDNAVNWLQQTTIKALMKSNQTKFLADKCKYRWRSV